MSERALFVTWFAPQKRAILPVARLVQRPEGDQETFEFRYIRGALEAITHGFRPFLAFPDLRHVYRSRALFPFFTNRVMPTTRPDYVSYVQSLGLEPGDADAVEILGRSGGKRETDRIEVVAAPAPDESGAWITHFLVRGIRYMPGAEERIGRLTAGERLFWMLDVQNPMNPGALALRTSDNQLIGYLPDYLVSDAVRLIEERSPVNVLVERVNPAPTPLHYRLLCKLEAVWSSAFAPFQGEQLQPLDPQAVAAPAELT
ncbi:MAG TPA: hypothetical protein VLS89_14345 [Candidatus Nanopelagicales bacterium]|nr:hypothetical protein [Candidatus Nanopelagicales bacterium]